MLRHDQNVDWNHSFITAQSLRYTGPKRHTNVVARTGRAWIDNEISQLGETSYHTLQTSACRGGQASQNHDLHARLRRAKSALAKDHITEAEYHYFVDRLFAHPSKRTAAPQSNLSRADEIKRAAPPARHSKPWRVNMAPPSPIGARMVLARPSR